MTKENIKSINQNKKKNIPQEFCVQCGEKLIHTPFKKPKRFCSKTCRLTWWRNHDNEISRKAFYNFKCAHCGKEFQAYGSANRKYCSHPCFIEARFYSK